METLQGRVSRVHIRACEAGQYGEWIIHVATFYIGDRLIEFDSWDVKPEIKDGDDVVVSGRDEDRRFVALAYRNLTTRGDRDVGMRDALIRAGLGVAMGVYVSGDHPTMAFLIGGFCFFLLVRAASIAMAVRGL